MRHAKTEKAAELAAGGLYAVQPAARTALAADPDPAPVADTTTYTDWEDLFGVGGSAYLTTKDIGRIWTDKSVSTQGYQTARHHHRGADEQHGGERGWR